MFGDLAIDHYPVGAVLISLTIAAAITLQLGLRRLLGADTIRDCHEVSGYYLSTVGAFYAVLLGLIVFDAMSRFQTADKTVDAEAKSILTIYSLSSQFPRQEANIKDLTRRYLDDVIRNEWTLMEKNQMSPPAGKAILDLMEVIKTIEPETENQKAIYPNILSEMLSWRESRGERSRVANFEIPAVEWLVLILGGGITIVFTFFFTLDRKAFQFAMTAMITLMLSMSLYLIYLFGDPFSGDLKIHEDALVNVRKFVTEHP
ncbi:MAG: hypothetical protein ACR652_10020 [Methylocystis sp.]|uniref:bestrophin-like domain n=1 Tax=Methylocystis sp. TaxID=1911079 RepID=UPI003DA2818C